MPSCRPGSVGDIATGYEPVKDGSWIVFRFGTRYSALVRIVPWGHTAPSTIGTDSLPRVKKRPVRDAQSSLLLVPLSIKSKCIPLLQIWDVRLVQSISAFTRVHCTLPLFAFKQTNRQTDIALITDRVKTSTMQDNE